MYSHESLHRPIDIVLNKPTSLIYLAKLSWDYICVVYELKLNPSFFSTKSLQDYLQLIVGYEK
jgi:hypothetical protein